MTVGHSIILLQWIRSLQAISQTGLHYAKDPFDVQRYRDVGRIAAEILAQHSELTTEQILGYHAAEFGYATPKVDVRGIVFRGDEILLVREIMDAGRWTVPGGWADAGAQQQNGSGNRHQPG